MPPAVRPNPFPKCPDWGTLADFKLGHLSELDLEAISDHVSVCQECETTLREMRVGIADGSLVDRLQRSLSARRSPRTQLSK